MWGWVVSDTGCGVGEEHWVWCGVGLLATLGVGLVRNIGSGVGLGC